MEPKKEAASVTEAYSEREGELVLEHGGTSADVITHYVWGGKEQEKKLSHPKHLI